MRSIPTMQGACLKVPACSAWLLCLPQGAYCSLTSGLPISMSNAGLTGALMPGTLPRLRVDQSSSSIADELEVSLRAHDTQTEQGNFGGKQTLNDK